MKIREMLLEDYEQVLKVWETTEGIGLSSADAKESIAIFLKRNQGLSLVVEKEGEIIATILCGHDGRRGYIHHLAVLKDYQGKGLGKRLVELSLKGLEEEGIKKCHLFVFNENQKGKDFWQRIGWVLRQDISVISKDLIFHEGEEVRC